MGLLTKEVEIKINAKNINWYKSKGYNCNLRDIITVEVNDLSKGTHIPVEYKCDDCGNTFTTLYSDYITHKFVGEITYCKKCVNNHKPDDFLVHNGYKICKRCNRKLPADSDHFNHKCDTKDGFTIFCKECLGRKFTDHLTHIPKEGYKFCIKCGKELPNTKQYFPIDNMCKDGLRNVCRCCGKDGHYLSDNYIPNKVWSKDDLNLLKSIYKDYTNEELVEKFFPNRTKHALDTQADKYGFAYKTEETFKRSCIQRGVKCSQKLTGRKLSKEQCKQLSKIRKEYYKTHISGRLGFKASEETKQRMSLAKKRVFKWKGKNNPRHIYPLNGELNGNWQGGITKLYDELRSETKSWQQLSMEFCNYHCVLTGGRFDNIHHLKPFKQIVDETFQIIQFDKRHQVLDYTNEEFEIIREVLNKLHTQYGYGVCLCKPVHKLFHDTYGYTNNTYNQFLDFVDRFESGEFNDWLIENKLKLNINYKVINYIKSIQSDKDLSA